MTRESSTDFEAGADRLANFLTLARTRRSVRAFRDEPIPDELLREVLEAANWAPSGANTQLWEFVVVEEEDRKRELAEVFRDAVTYKRKVDPEFPAGGNFGEFIDAPVSVVVAGDIRFERWWPQILDGSREKLFQQSLAACIQNLHLAAAAAGLGTTWATVREPTTARLRRLFDLPDFYRIGTVAPLGYPDWDRNPTTRPRIPVEYKIHHDTLDRDRVPQTEEIIEGRDGWMERVYGDADQDS